MKVIVLALLLLGGCTSFGQDVDELTNAARAYVREVHDARREVRRICWDMLLAEVKQLEADGKPDEARARLRANYPPLVTVSIVTKTAEDPTSLSTEPFGCD